MYLCEFGDRGLGKGVVVVVWGGIGCHTHGPDLQDSFSSSYN